MDVDFIQVAFLQIIVFTAGSHIALFEEVALGIMGDESPYSEVEFSAFEQEWLLNVLLDNKGVTSELEGLFSFDLILLALVQIC